MKLWNLFHLEALWKYGASLVKVQFGLAMPEEDVLDSI